jgi:antitoxin component YwqK of YwqJK toxin-antitoxin module
MEPPLIQVSEPHSFITTYYRNGHKKEVFQKNEHDRLEGLYNSFHENGNLYVICYYKDGKKEGKYQVYHEDGKNLEKEFHLKNGILEGSYKSWYENKEPHEFLTYKNGLEEGRYQKWYPDKQIENDYCYVQGQKHGRYLTFFENGNKSIESYYKMGVKEGKCTWFYKSGKVMEEMNYINDLLDGKYTSWHENGVKWTDYIYKNDSIIKVISITDENGRDCILLDNEIDVWKACRTKDNINVYVRIRVPENARRVTPVDAPSGYKSRIEFGKVMEIVDEEGKYYNEATSFVYKELKYVLSKVVIPDGFDDNINHCCGKGISVHKYKDQCEQWFGLDKINYDR